MRIPAHYGTKLAPHLQANYLFYPVLDRGGFARAMLFYSLVFVILAVLAAMFGFEIATTSFAALAKLGFSIFVAGFVVSLGVHLKRRV